MNEKITKIPSKIFSALATRGVFRRLNDKKYIEGMYYSQMQQKLNLQSPVTFNEKLQWLKLYDRRDEYTVMVDKYKVREYIADKIGEKYLVPLIDAWDSADDIDFDALPDKFALKCNHNSGLGMCICADKSKLNVDKARAELRRGLAQDYYLTGREWPYKNVPRKIIAEQFMKSDAGGLTDYKIHCFGGVPRFVLVCKDRFAESGLTEDFFTPEWEHMDVKRPAHPNALSAIEKPAELEEMLSLAATLSKDIPFLRVDFYIIDHRVYFSELTFFPASGFEGYDPPEWDETFGSWLELPR